MEHRGNAPRPSCLQGISVLLYVPHWSMIPKRPAPDLTRGDTGFPKENATKHEFPDRYLIQPDRKAFGAQGRFRAHLSAASARRFHQISFLGELVRTPGIEPGP